jgi:hypothetical protein
MMNLHTDLLQNGSAAERDLKRRVPAVRRERSRVRVITCGGIAGERE